MNQSPEPETDTAQATAPQNNAVVDAAAGTGKTWLLTTRIVRLLLAGVAPGAILAITFTRKAAGEIHDRVSRRLEQLAQADKRTLEAVLGDMGIPVTAETSARSQELYESLLAATHPLRATTFHAFCQDVLRRFPLEAEVAPGFELIEATHEPELEAWRRFDREITRASDSPLAQAAGLLLRECGYEGARQALRVFLAHRSDWWAYSELEEDPAAAAAARLEKELGGGGDPLAAFLANDPVRQQLGRYQELLARHATATNEKLVVGLARARAPEVPAEEAWNLIREILLKADDTPRALSATKSLAKSLGEAGAGELVALHEALCAHLLAAREELQRHATLHLSRAWFRCGHRLLEHFQQAKEEHGLLDFADLEWKTYRLLSRSQHAEWVQYKLDQRIEHLLVDEFQDTNPTQWRLLLPLLEEMAAGGERPRSVFLVGDEKQSIYRFRRAEPELFRVAHRWLMQHARARTFTQHVSWRSSPAVIRFVNLVFGEAPDETNDGFRLHGFRAHDTRHESLWGRAELLPLVAREADIKPMTPTTLRDPLERPRTVAEDVRHRREGELIAAKIGELLGAPVAARDGEANGADWRPLDYGDIMILLRDRTHAPAYEEALRRAGIPYLGGGRGTFLDCLEIRDLVHLLRALVAPYDDLALASTLRAPFFAAAEEDLVRLAKMPDDSSWRERLERMPLSPADISPLARAQRLLARWGAYADRIPVHDLLDRIYHEGDVIGRYVSAAPAHLKSRVEANLNRLLDLALEVDGGRYPSLARFLGRLETLAREDGAATIESAAHAGRRVRLLTIHAAKGLEAPAVFLADAARDPRIRERGAHALIHWPVTELRPRHFHLCAARAGLDGLSRRLLTEQERAAWREETNLLYVALTRARQLLFVSGCEPGRGDRGWYGFLERRLRAAESSGAAARAGLVVRHIPRPGTSEPYVTCGRLEHGSPPPGPSVPVAPAAEEQPPPDLTRPLPPLAGQEWLHPSLLPGEDDRPEPGAAAGAEPARAKRRGIALHRMLELLTENGPHAEASARQEFADLPAELLDECWREARAVADHPPFREWFDPSRFAAARNEVPILYRDGERDVYGVIDRLVLRRDEAVLLDYKTHAQAGRGDVARLAQGLAPQLRLYGRGVQRIWPDRKLRLLLLFTACREVVEIAPG